jgi:hypothetical protein
VVLQQHVRGGGVGRHGSAFVTTRCGAGRLLRLAPQPPPPRAGGRRRTWSWVSPAHIHAHTHTRAHARTHDTSPPRPSTHCLHYRTICCGVRGGTNATRRPSTTAQPHTHAHTHARTRTRSSLSTFTKFAYARRTRRNASQIGRAFVKGGQRAAKQPARGERIVSNGVVVVVTVVVVVMVVVVVVVSWW